jgi:large subunit ribosomal protein L1
MMRHLGKVARVLGPKGLMPNPKTGTVGEDLVAVVKDIAGGTFEFRTDKQ